MTFQLVSMWVHKVYIWREYPGSHSDVDPHQDSI